MLNEVKKILVLSVLTLTLQAASYADSLKIYVITPRIAIDWSTPRTLAVSTGLNSIGNDYAPIGHFAVELNCSNTNHYGKTHVLTGMERQNKKESQRIVMKQKLGFGSLTYSFLGALQLAAESAREIDLARAQHRLKEIVVPTTPARCDQMMEYLSDWIEAGSYNVYGGGKDTEHGEGAGCADFAMQFFEMATGEAVPHEWFAKIAIPTALIGSADHPVPFTRLLARSKWAQIGEPQLHFQIPDTNLVDHWLQQQGVKQSYTWPTNLEHPAAALAAFRFHYPTTEPPEAIWNRI